MSQKRYSRILGRKYVPRADRIALTIGDREWTWRELGDMGEVDDLQAAIEEGKGSQAREGGVESHPHSS